MNRSFPVALALTVTCGAALAQAPSQSAPPRSSSQLQAQGGSPSQAQAGSPSQAQSGSPSQSQPGSLSAEMKADYVQIRDYVIRAAEKMPEADYGFKPTPEVRSFGQQIAHVADDQYNLCAPAKGETRNAPYRDIETRLSAKADLVAALRGAFAYCDAVYDAMTDASGLQPVAGRNRTRFGMLNWNLWHTWEHYGNMVVYLRIKGLVPPSSEPMRGM